ncbi:hypothetical protein Ccrd_020638, partial [Cynara cardunculus var. scolymus]
MKEEFISSFSSMAITKAYGTLLLVGYILLCSLEKQSPRQL